MAALLAAILLVLGPTGFIFDTFTTTLGSYLNQLVTMSLRMSPFSGSTWVADWTIFYWAWWISWAPFVGSFIARISRGRSVREFVIGVVLAPTLLGFFWFAVFGGTALWAQIFGHADLVQALGNGYETVLFTLFDSMPLPLLLSCIALVLLMIFFVTSADSAVLVLASMSTDEAGDPPLKRKLAWGIAVALIAAALLLAGGLDALQGMITIAALPFALLMVLVMVSLYRVLDQEYTRERRQAQRQRHMIDAWIAREMAAQEETGGGSARARSGLRGFAACGCAAFKQRQQQLQKRLWISAGLAGRADGETRRKYVPVGSATASMPWTVPPSPPASGNLPVTAVDPRHASIRCIGKQEGSDPFSFGKRVRPNPTRAVAVAVAFALDLLLSLPAVAAAGCPWPGGWVGWGREPHGPEACLGRVGPDAQPRSYRVRRTVHTSKRRPSLWTYLQRPQTIHPPGQTKHH